MDLEIPTQKGTRQQVPDLYVADQTPIRAGGVGDVANPDFSVPPLQPVGNGTLGGLVKIAGKLLEPAMKRETEAQFFEGMARAAADEAAADIAAERPAWANFFGEGAAVAGARAYEGQRDATEFENGLLSQMRSHRELPPLQYAEAVRQAVNKRLSGDPVRDQQLQASALRALPGLMKLHAKEHLTFNQEQAWKARGSAMSAAFDQVKLWYQNQRSGVTALTAGTPEVPVSEDDMDAARGKFIAALAPFPGEDEDMRDRQLVQVAKEAIGKGNLDVVHALKDAGVWGQLDAQVRDTLQADYDAVGRRIIGERVMTQTMDRISNFLLNPGNDGATIDKGLDEFNTVVRAETGIDVDLFGPEYRLRLRGEGARDAAVAAQAADKAAGAAEVRSLARRNLLDPRVLTGEIEPGTSKRFGFTDGYSKAETMEAEVAWASTTQLADPVKIGQARAVILLNYGTEGRKLDAAESWVASALTGDTPSVSGLALVAAIDAAPEGGKPIIQAYLSREQQAFVAEYKNTLQTPGITPADAWKQARAAARVSELTANIGKLEKSDVTIVDRAVKDYQDKTLGFGGKDLTPLGMGALRALVARNLKDNVVMGGDAARGAVALAKSLQDFRLEGEIGYLPMDRKLPSLQSRIGGAPKEASDALKKVFENKTGSIPNPETLSFITASADPDGALVFHSQYVDMRGGNARAVAVRIHEREIRDALRTIIDKKKPKTVEPLTDVIQPWDNPPQ